MRASKDLHVLSTAAHSITDIRPRIQASVKRCVPASEIQSVRLRGFPSPVIAGSSRLGVFRCERRGFWLESEHVAQLHTCGGKNAGGGLDLKTARVGKSPPGATNFPSSMVSYIPFTDANRIKMDDWLADKETSPSVPHNIYATWGINGVRTA